MKYPFGCWMLWPTQLCRILYRYSTLLKAHTEYAPMNVELISVRAWSFILVCWPKWSFSVCRPNQSESIRQVEWCFPRSDQVISSSIHPERSDSTRTQQKGVIFFCMVLWYLWLAEATFSLAMDLRIFFIWIICSCCCYSTGIPNTHKTDSDFQKIASPCVCDEFGTTNSAWRLGKSEVLSFS